MNEGFQLNLALILFLPWYAILAGIYWFYPRQPRTRERSWFDAGAIAAALGASVLAMHWGVLNANTGYGGMWKQVLATSLSYGAFLAVLTAAVFLRSRLIIRPHMLRAASEFAR